MNPESIQIWTLAIHSKKIVSFTCDRQYRDCSPRALGHKGGKVNVLVYQFAGQTSKGPDSGGGLTWTPLPRAHPRPVRLRASTVGRA